MENGQRYYEISMKIYGNSKEITQKWMRKIQSKHYPLSNETVLWEVIIISFFHIKILFIYTYKITFEKQPHFTQ
jgi:hypothetical protein